MRYRFNSILLSLCAISCAGCRSGHVMTFSTSSEQDEGLPEFRPGDSFQVNLRQNADGDGLALPDEVTYRTSALVTEAVLEERQLTVSFFVAATNPASMQLEEGGGYQLDVELTGVLDAPVDGGELPTTI